MDEIVKGAAEPHISAALDAIQRGQTVSSVLGGILVLAIFALAVLFIASRRDQRQVLEIVRSQNGELNAANNERVDKMLAASADRFQRIEAAIDQIEGRLDEIKDRLRDFGLQVIAVYREAMGLRGKDDPPKT